MPRDDAKAWSKKVDSILRSTLRKDKDSKEVEVRDEARHEKILQRIARQREAEQTDEIGHRKKR